MTIMASNHSSNPPPRRSSASGADVDRVLLAGVFIVVGGVLLASVLNLLPAIGSASLWDWLMLGAGSLLLLSELVRAVTVQYSQPSMGRLIVGGVLLALALSAIFGVNVALLWPAALVVAGIILLARSIFANL